MFHKTYWKRSVNILIVGMTAHFTAWADGPATNSQLKTEVLSVEQRAKNLESFDYVWKTIHETHFDPTFGGLDWLKVRDELRPKVEQASTMSESRNIINAAIERLGLSHFGTVPAEIYKALDNPDGGPGEIGIDIRIINNQAVVASVLEGSPAERANVKPGWVIEKVGGRTTAEIFTAVEKALKSEPLRPSYMVRGVLGLLQGKVGDSASITFRDRDDRMIEVKIPHALPQGNIAKFGNLPDMRVRYTSKRIDSHVGYVSLNIFFDPARVLDLYAKSIEDFQDTDGLIIDLRGNPGGVGAMALGMGSWLVTDPDQKLGTMITRDSKFNFALNPRAIPFEKPVAVLVDELSTSTSEILAGGLQDLKRARIFGTKTPGAALPSQFDVLPNGDRFQHAFANYISAGGKPLEGVGVTPDEIVPLTLEALRSDHDRALEAATAWITSKRNK